MKNKIKTIDINGKQWIDKRNGNSYFSAVVTVNNGLNDQDTIYIPFQLGYEFQYIHTAFNSLKQWNVIPIETKSLRSFIQEKGVKLTTNIKTNCTKKEVKEFGKF